MEAANKRAIVGLYRDVPREPYVGHISPWEDINTLKIVVENAKMIDEIRMCLHLYEPRETSRHKFLEHLYKIELISTSAQLVS